MDEAGYTPGVRLDAGRGQHAGTSLHGATDGWEVGPGERARPGPTLLAGIGSQRRLRRGVVRVVFRPLHPEPMATLVPFS